MNVVTETHLRPAYEGWPLRVLVALTRRAYDCLARAGRSHLDAGEAAVGDDSLRFMNDLSGGGSRAREAARWLDR